MRKNRGEGSAGVSEFSLDGKTRQLLVERNAVFLDTLFREVNPFLGRICISNGIFSENADEVIHETWERFFSNLDKFEGRSQIRTFICGILFNKIREYRRAQAKTIYEDDSEQVMSHAFTPEGWWNAEPSDPSKLVEMRQTADLVKECLEGLSEQQKAAFVMREVEEEDSDSICNVLGVNVSHLRVLLFRAKDKLRKCLEGQANAT
jgi:RNA polymerase sigma factor (sigma-70 family)